MKESRWHQEQSWGSALAPLPNVAPGTVGGVSEVRAGGLVGNTDAKGSLVLTPVSTPLLST